MMAGPLLGSGLYAIGGFQLPFYVTGAGLFLLTIFTYFTLPDSENYAPDMRLSPTSGTMVKNVLTYKECLSNVVRINQFIVNFLEGDHDCFDCYTNIMPAYIQRAYII
jgi:hypothetical protein